MGGSHHRDDGHPNVDCYDVISRILDIDTLLNFEHFFFLPCLLSLTKHEETQRKITSRGMNCMVPLFIAT